MPSTVSPVVLVLLAIGYIAWGTVQTLSLKWADSLAAPDRFGCHSPVGQDAQDGVNGRITVTLLYSFAHPFTQALFMFCAETICLVVFAAVLLYKRYLAQYLWWSRHEPRKLVRGEDICLPCNPGVWLLTAGADFIASIVQNVGMTLTYASAYQMLRGATVCWIAVISYVWLGRRFTKVECWGMGFVVLGLTCVGLSSILKRGSGDGTEEVHEHQMLGNLLVISAQVLHAYQGVCQERLVHMYRIPPLQMVGTEGVYGIGMTLVLLAVLQLVPTATWGHNVVGLRETLTFSPSLDTNTRRASLPRDGSAVSNSALYTNVTWLRAHVTHKVPFDDVILAFDQMGCSTACLLATLTYIAAGVFYNACQMSIIKHLSAAATVMMGSLRNVSVWAVCLLLPSVFHETFNVVQFIGFLFLVFGNVLFQRVWITRFDEVLPEKVMRKCQILFKDDSAELATDDVVIEPSSSISAVADATSGGSRQSQQQQQSNTMQSRR